MKKNSLLLFGGTGAIGSSIEQYFINRDWRVTIVTRKAKRNLPNQIEWDVLHQNSGFTSAQSQSLKRLGPFNAVCWAQGMNVGDNIYNFDMDVHNSVYQANVGFIICSLSQLLQNNFLSQSANLCIISSIWQNIARQDKMSYCVSKSALRGLVLSLAADLGREKHMVNAVLPGVLDTPMTRRNLDEVQLTKILERTQHRSLPLIDDVARAVFDLCRPENRSITGQFLSVDLGFENVTAL
jgi:3-oxoacyl-[acyl-carrier protein] reductase